MRWQADFSRNCSAVSSPLDPVPQRDAAYDAMGRPDRSDWWMTSYQHFLRRGVPSAKSLKRSWGLGFLLRGRESVLVLPWVSRSARPLTTSHSGLPWALCLGRQWMWCRMRGR